MDNLILVYNKVEESNIILSEVIANAKKQGALDFDMFFYLQDGLNELSTLIENKQNISYVFLKKWDNVMGWAPKVFEDHPLLYLLREIDEAIMKIRN
jgi:hypothetical protein